MTDTSRIKEIPENAMSEAQKKVFADLVAGRGKLLAPYKIWIHSPVVAEGMEHIGTHLNKKGTLSKREVEIGRSDDDAVEVATGLKPVEDIAVGNTFLLKAELGKSEADHAH